MIEEIAIQRQAVQSGAIVSLQQIRGYVAMHDIPKGAQLLASDFAVPSNCVAC
jgi:hypothetical protein